MSARSRVLAALWSFALLAGCAADAPGPAAEDAPTLHAANDASECQLAVAVVLASFAQAASALPEGFVPRDAQALLGAPAPTGRAGILLGSYRCGTSALDPAGLAAMEVNVLVETPEVAGERAASSLDYYQPVVYTSSTALLALLADVGWNAVAGDTSVEVATLASGARGSGGASDPDGVAASFEATGLAPSSLAGLSRFWHDTPGGLSHFDFTVDADVLAGAASCELRPGSAVAEVAGLTECAPGDALGIVVPSLSWESEFRHLPGVSAS